MPSNPNTTATKRLRWNREKRHGVGYPTIYSLSRGGPALAYVQLLSGTRWFWYCPGISTADRPATLEACQREAMNHIRSKELCTDGQ